LLDAIGLSFEGERLAGYVAHLPDREVTLFRDTAAWRRERLQKLGDTPAHRRFWALLDELAEVFWDASRAGVKLPIRSAVDLARATRCVSWRGLRLARYVRWTLGDALRAHGLRGDAPLVGLLSMLVEDTVHASVDEAPLINAALGITIRGAGLTRAAGGMAGFWSALVARYRALGGTLKLGCRVKRVDGREGAFAVHTQRGTFLCRQVVSALPLPVTAQVAPHAVRAALRPFLHRDRHSLGGAVVVFLGVPEEEVAGEAFTHHQLMHDYAAPLGEGNNMFVSVSAAGDERSAPAGHRAVMLSTHCELDGWRELSPGDYEARKTAVGDRLVELARRVFPHLGDRAVVREVATPCTYARFTGRPLGAVGGVRQTLRNSNQNAVPHDLGVPGFWVTGDGTWPGLGTVACCLSSRIVAEGVLARDVVVPAGVGLRAAVGGAT
jgi:phytoene dehydrogenase-like protein